VAISFNIRHFFTPVVGMQIDFSGICIHPSQHDRPHEGKIIFCSGYNRLVQSTLSVGSAFHQHLPTQAFYIRKINDFFRLNG
jgi:hypothetical protein